MLELVVVVRRAFLIALAGLALAPAAASAQARVHEDVRAPHDGRNWNVAAQLDRPRACPGATDVVVHHRRPAPRSCQHDRRPVRAIRSERPVRNTTPLTLNDATEPSTFTTLTRHAPAPDAGRRQPADRDRCIWTRRRSCPAPGTTTVTTRHEFIGRSAACLGTGRNAGHRGHRHSGPATTSATGDVTWTNRAAITVPRRTATVRRPPRAASGPSSATRPAASVTRTTSNQQLQLQLRRSTTTA